MSSWGDYLKEYGPVFGRSALDVPASIIGEPLGIMTGDRPGMATAHVLSALDAPAAWAAGAELEPYNERMQRHLDELRGDVQNYPKTAVAGRLAGVGLMAAVPFMGKSRKDTLAAATARSEANLADEQALEKVHPVDFKKLQEIKRIEEQGGPVSDQDLRNGFDRLYEKLRPGPLPPELEKSAYDEPLTGAAGVYGLKKLYEHVKDNEANRSPQSTTGGPWAGLARSPIAESGLPLWAASPTKVVEPRDQHDDTNMLGLAMLNRYPNRQPEDVLGDFSKEVIPNTRIRVVNHPNGLVNENGETDIGLYNPDDKTIHLNARYPTEEKIATFAHELGHAADDVQGFVSEDPTNGLHHHKYFTRFEPEMAQSMDAQRAIEMGWPVNPAIPSQYPWLNQVKPLSSNKLATPWGFDF